MATIEQGKKQFAEKLTAANIPDYLSEKLRYKKLKEITSDLILPASIYRFCSPSKFNMDSLEQDKVFLSEPSKFNDPFDNAFYVNEEIGKNLARIAMNETSILDTIKDVENSDIPEQLLNSFNCTKTEG